MPGTDPLAGLDPGEIWRHFGEFTKIARPSGQEEGMRSYIEAWARDHDFRSQRDAAGNLIVRIPATPGREGAPIVILQGHLDMVCTRDSDAGANDPTKGKIAIVRGNEAGSGFVPDPLGAWIKADRTSLGADDGIGVASMLAVAADASAAHGPIELLFTIDEETGLTGATNLDASLLRGKVLLNLDSEEDDILTIGSAGGRDVHLTWARSRAEVPTGWDAVGLKLSGLHGGHSGVDINRGRLNAIKGLVRILDAAGAAAPFRLVSIDGGDRGNAIPREATAVLVVPGALKDRLLGAAQGAFATLRREFEKTDEAMALELSAPGSPAAAESLRGTSTLVDLLQALPSGVVAMSQSLEGLVQTSCNLGILSTLAPTVNVACSLRSSVDAALEDLTGAFRSIAALANTGFEASPSYPGWEPDPTSRVLEFLRSTYRSTFGSDPKVQAVHAGLECGVIRARVPGLDTISFGPTIRGAHSTLERVNIASVAKFYRLLRGARRAIPVWQIGLAVRALRMSKNGGSSMSDDIMSRRDALAATGLAALLLGGPIVPTEAAGSEEPAQGDSSRGAPSERRLANGPTPLAGRWTYRSFKKDTLEVWVDGELEIYESRFGTLEGKLTVQEEGKPRKITLKGTVSYGNPPELHYSGVGDPQDDLARSWAMEYRAYLVPSWPYGKENTQDAIVGSLTRVKDNDQGGKAGYVGLWMAVRKER